MRRVAAHSRAHLKLSPIRICCLTSRLPQIGCSDLTQGSTGEKKLLKDFAAGAASERPALTVVLAHPRGVGAHSTSAAPGDTPAEPGDPHLEQPAPLPSSPPQLPPPARLRSRLGSAAAQPPAKLPPCGHPVGLHPAAHGLSAESSGIPRECAGAGRVARPETARDGGSLAQVGTPALGRAASVVCARPGAEDHVRGAPGPGTAGRNPASGWAPADLQRRTGRQVQPELNSHLQPLLGRAPSRADPAHQPAWRRGPAWAPISAATRARASGGAQPAAPLKGRCSDRGHSLRQTWQASRALQSAAGHAELRGLQTAGSAEAAAAGVSPRSACPARWDSAGPGHRLLPAGGAAGRGGRGGSPLTFLLVFNSECIVTELQGNTKGIYFFPGA